MDRTILEHLKTRYSTESCFSLLDVPCGGGGFLASVRATFPDAETTGADILLPADHSDGRFFQVDASNSTLSELDERFDVITCISGVMEFGNTLSFFKDIRTVLADDGLLIVTNDNLLTVRDRILYLVSGRFGQYPLDLERTTPTWQVTPVQNIVRVLRDAGFEIESMRFVPVRTANWLWLPIALPLFLISRFNRSIDPPFVELRSLRSFLSRHYILLCRRASNTGAK